MNRTKMNIEMDKIRASNMLENFELNLSDIFTESILLLLPTFHLNRAICQGPASLRLLRGDTYSFTKLFRE